jgi:DNA-binding CsgD family transcriptional regulator
LSARERTVVQLIAEGHTSKKIASILDLSVKTIETHRAAAHHKLNVSSTAGLVRCYSQQHDPGVGRQSPPARMMMLLQTHGADLEGLP